MGRDVQLRAVSILHGSLSSRLRPSSRFLNLRHWARANSGCAGNETESRRSAGPGGSSWARARRSSNWSTACRRLGQARGLIAILQALKPPGALEADLEVCEAVFGFDSLFSRRSFLTRQSRRSGAAHRTLAGSTDSKQGPWQDRQSARQFEAQLLTSVLASLESRSFVPGSDDSGGWRAVPVAATQSLASLAERGRCWYCAHPDECAAEPRLPKTSRETFASNSSPSRASQTGVPGRCYPGDVTHGLDACRSRVAAPGRSWNW